MNYLIALLICIISSTSLAQQSTFSSKEIPISKYIDGTLLSPNDSTATLAILIADSGPIDRDGNQDFQKTDNLKKLAVAMTKNGIATFRYDKRIVKQLRRGNFDVNIKFENFVNDAMDVIDYFQKQHNYNKIFIIGHGQGSLIGMIVAKDNANGFISLAGSGKSIDALILDQVQLTAPMFTEDTQRIIATLKDGKTTTNYPQALSSMFDVSVQPFMASWMAYNPLEEIEKLEIPVLIINGTKDLQVSEEETKQLNEAASHSELKFIEKMNHVLFVIEGDDQENAKSYNNQSGKVSEILITDIVKFIKK